MTPPRIVVIVGPTASGKSALAVRLAKKLGGEIVSADSRLLYKGMDIGTAKPSAAERRSVPHHLIDIVPPSRTLTLAEFKRRAVRAIRGIVRRDRVPILVGGTGLYVQAIVENMEIPEVPPDPAYRAFLERKGKAWILSRLEKLDPAYAARIGPNPRYAARALEVIRATGRPFGGQQGKGKPLFEALLLGLDPGKAALRRRIARRVGAMFRAGLVGEVRRLAGRYGWDVPAMSGIGYRELKPLLEGTIGAREAEKTLVKRTSLYAKRQMTWWRRMKGIRWFTDPKQALREAISWLNTAKKRT
jgi:tRNA dimethylallyltransferase